MERTQVATPSQPHSTASRDTFRGGVQEALRHHTARYRTAAGLAQHTTTFALTVHNRLRLDPGLSLLRPQHRGDQAGAGPTLHVEDSLYKSLQRQSRGQDISMPLPTRTKEGYKCLFARYIDFNYKNYDAVDAIRTVLMTLDLWQCEEGTWPGFVMIVDLEGATLGHLTTVDFKNVQHFFFFFQEAMFMKLKGIHLLNPPSFIDKVLAVFRSILKKSLMEGIHVHPAGSRTIDQFFPMDQLPKDCGGTYQTLAECRDEILMKLKANGEFFQKESKKRVTESLRPGKPKTFTDFFGGIEGSFKKLDID